ncbi:hypothetical protein ZWY2020_048428 [Hordeum vulgare]|nr:hypothetical protein ZWY2020_048428 [Hordeum vulgare]
MGLAHGGVEFLKGTLPGLESYAVGIMTKSRRGKYYIDNSLWEPEADSVESGYRVPFGKVNVFISMIGMPVPELDISTDIVEPDRYVLPITRWDRSRHVFVGFTQGDDAQDEVACQEITPVNVDDESSMCETESIHPLKEGQLGGLSLAMDPMVYDRYCQQIAIYMAGSAQPQQNPTGNNEAGGTSKPPTQTMTELAAEVASHMATTITSENQESVNAELAKLQEAMAKAHRDMEAEAARIEMQQATVAAEMERLNTEGSWHERQQRASDAAHQRRHNGRIPDDLHPTRLFDTSRTPGAGPDRPLQTIQGGGSGC